MQLNLVPHPQTPPSETVQGLGERRPFGRVRRDRHDQHVVLRRCADEPLRASRKPQNRSARKICGRRLASRRSCAFRAPSRIANGISRRRVSGRLTTSPRIARAGRTQRSADPYIRLEDNLIWWAVGATISGRCRCALGTRRVGNPRREGRHQILLGAGASARATSPTSTTRLASPRTCLNQAAHDHFVRYRSAARRAGTSPPARRQASRPARPSGLGDARPDA